MKICIWRTGHEIADTVATALSRAFNAPIYHATEILDLPEADIHIGYGILRGMSSVYKRAERDGKPYFIIDRGYWKPSHYDGYYRVSLRGTQQTSGWPEPDWERWEALGLPIEPARPTTWTTGHPVLLCPPSTHVAEWLGVNLSQWIDHATWDQQDSDVTLRFKGGNNDTIDWGRFTRVITFNSSVGWEALRRGIPVESDHMHSIVGAWQAKHGVEKRAELFATMAGLQLTLDEMRGGKLMPLMEKLLAKSLA